MFKSILPSKKVPDAEFHMITPPVDSSKENYPAFAPANTGKTRLDKPKKSKSKDTTPVEPAAMEEAFDRLLVGARRHVTQPKNADALQDELQIPDTLRPKLATMETSVKAAMLKSSHTLSKGSVMPSSGLTQTLRRAHSSQSINSLTSREQAQRQAVDDTDAMISPKRPAMHTRGKSLDKVQGAAPADVAKGNKDKGGKGSVMTPAKYCSVLTSMSSTHLDMEVLKKLRLMLRNESARCVRCDNATCSRDS